MVLGPQTGDCCPISGQKDLFNIETHEIDVIYTSKNLFDNRITRNLSPDFLGKLVNSGRRI